MNILFQLLSVYFECDNNNSDVNSAAESLRVTL